MPSARSRQIVPALGVVLVLIVLVVIRVESGLGTTTTTTTATATTTSTSTVPTRPTTPAVTAADARRLLGGIHFTDVTRSSGIAFPPSTRRPTDDPSTGMTSGSAVADYDGDGRPDVLLTAVGRSSALFHNDGDGHFTDVTAASGLPTSASQGATAASFADIDGDGHLDLLILGFGTAPDQLFRNDGSGRFVIDRSSGIVLGTGGHAVARLGATFADVDGNGALDLLETHWDQYAVVGSPAGPPPDPRAGSNPICAYVRDAQAHKGPRPPGVVANRTLLYLNDGTGHFRDATAAMGLDLSTSVAFTPVFADLDGDGAPELLLTGDACTSRVFRLDADHRFVDVTASLHVGTDENGMGSVVRDLNGDGLPDWFVTSIDYPTAGGRCPTGSPFEGCSGDRLYLGRPDGTFEDATDAYGLRDGGWGWGAAIEDFGNDGRLAVTLTNGYEPPGDVATSSPFSTYDRSFLADQLRFWVHSPHGYVDVATAAGLTDRGIGHGLVAFDYDGDGRLDLLVANGTSSPRLYRNTTAGPRSWLTVRLSDPAHPGNRQGIGAKVSISTRAGARPTVQWISTAGSYMAQKPPEAHVGFGTEPGLDPTVTVTWPGTDRPQVFTHVRADTIVTLTRA